MTCPKCRYEVHVPKVDKRGFTVFCSDCVKAMKSAKNIIIAYRKTA